VRKTKRIYFSKSCLSIKLWGAIAGVAILLGVMAPPEANAWWDGKWQQRKVIQFDASSAAANIKENLTDVPALMNCRNRYIWNPELTLLIFWGP
jgi:hypothetical protein